jgi:D-tagatose-1,6-bisphosphate aldolase subunit GatZ/KbaZ
MRPSTVSLCQIFDRNRAGDAVGVYSVCSAHPEVIAAALELARDRDQLAVIEATCNQVNQDGGYTGMRPTDFVKRVGEAAEAAGLTTDRVVLGGDHLGPQPWCKAAAQSAMDKAGAMVDAYVRAGFSKIHLDCSMRCADDPALLAESTIAERAADLAVVAEAAARDTGLTPFYIIGTEVPPPGGMGEGHAITPTDPASVAQTWAMHEAAFRSRGLASAFARVRSIVVQPGLDFGNEEVVHFEPSKSQQLSRSVADLGHAVFEAHSTDYQRPEAYKALVEGHFAILKVGPAATFALREAIYAVELMAREQGYSGPSVRDALEAAMLARPSNWQSHYSGTPTHQHYLRHFSYSDRLRYYWTEPRVEAAVSQLFAQAPAPTLLLVSHYLPQLLDEVQRGTLAADPTGLVRAVVKRALIPYADACGVHFR